MRELWQEIKRFFRKGDLILLVWCLAASSFSCVVISSVTNAEKFGGSSRYLIVQMIATLLGVAAYILFSSIDIDFFSEHRGILVVLNLGMLLMLIPFGTWSVGNRSWLHLPLIPFDIQPAEICKIFFIVILASVMNSHQNRISSPKSVIHLAAHTILLFVVNVAISHDVGVSLIFVFIFVCMAFAGGVKMIWFLGAAGIVVAALPVAWDILEGTRFRDRIQALFDPSVDPTGLGVLWQTNLSLKSLTGGGLTGQGLFNGTRTQAGSLPAQHTDFIFSSIGEELGYVGCVIVLILLFIIIFRCIRVGMRTKDYMRRMVCYGAAAALAFQVVINVGMCIGVMPIIGLTLPLISYGGSSVVTIYAMLGLVSGVHARPAPRVHERYIQPPR